ncbi:MAG: Gfo/Idh/MocA family oxidoreductase [Clostridia bacterium]|nr:Gfo/Idh/MocA family oxidoreductase [Clostridia bacterium]
MTIKWGVIGCGGIADRRTIPGMMLADNAELVAVMDANSEAANNVAEKYGAKYAFDNIADLLNLKEIQAVYIASPVFCHKEQCYAAADAGKHILLEKPMGLTTAEAKEIDDYCHSNGVMLGVGFMMRFHSYHQKMRELIAKGRLGEIVSARAQLTCWYPEIENCWRQDSKLSGGGAMMDMGIHCIDLIRYITGLEISHVTGMVGNQIFKYNAEDAGAAVFKLENGALCYVDANFNIPDAAAKCKLEFYGTKGSIFAEGTISQAEGGRIEVLCVDDAGGYDAGQTREEIRPVEVNVQFGNMYTKEIEGFGRAIAGEGEIPVAAADAILSQKAIEAVYESSKSGKTITLGAD